MPTKQETKAAKALKKQQKRQGPGLVPYGQHKKADWRHSTNDQLVTVPNFTAQQQGILDKINNYLAGQRGGLQGTPAQSLNLPGSQMNSFTPLRNEAMRSFHQETVPLLAERFTGLTNAASSSPALHTALGGAGSALESQLAALEAQYNLQNQGMQSGNYFNLLQAGLAPQYGVGNIPGQSSGVRNVAQGLLNAGIGAAGNYLGGRSYASGVLGALNNNQVQAQQTATGFNPNQGIGFSPYSYSNALNTNQSILQGLGMPQQQQGLGIQGINNAILHGYNNQLLG